jgi:NAD(P) transhydrogenase subunit alpha
MSKRLLTGALVCLGWTAAMLTASAASAQETAGASAVAASGGSSFIDLLFVFILATFIGLGVITRVSRLLHTPLMSLTNAISAIAIVGSLVIAGQQHPSAINLLGAVAIFASMTNIVSGFLITDRMLKMFKQQERPPK